MVEHPALLLRCWRRSGASGALRREVADPESGRLLGFVHRPNRPFAWLTRQADEIHESEDDSLLATLWRPWFVIRSWEIYDAENKRRGIVYGPSVLDGAGHRLARLEPAPDRRSGRFVDADGKELATLERRGEEALLGFTGAMDPFTRMALLAAALSLP